MPDYSYTARDRSGQKVTGTITAPNQRDVLAELAGKALFPVEVTAQQVTTALGFSTSTRIKPQLMATSYGQLAGLMRSGVPLLKALSVLRDCSSHAGLKEVLTQVSAQVEDGVTLADAMARYPKAFSEMAINMTRAGGEGGFLEDALDRVATFTELQEDIKSRTIGAVAYPTMLAMIGSVVITILIVFFVPKFAPLFESLREQGQLPLLTQWLLLLSGVLGSWWGLGCFLVAIAGAALVYQWAATPQGRETVDRLKLRIPVVGGICLNMAVSRFCRVLGTLLKNGVPILRSLEISSAATGNRVLALAVQDAAQNISSGESLAAPLAASGHFPRDVVEMVHVAEESNTLETVLVDISDSLDRRTWRQLDLFVRILEPLMLLVMAGVVLMVAVGLLLPMMKMSTMI